MEDPELAVVMPAPILGIPRRGSEPNLEALKEQDELAERLAQVAEEQERQRQAGAAKPRGKWWTGWTADKQKRAASPPPSPHRITANAEPIPMILHAPPPSTEAPSSPGAVDRSMASAAFLARVTDVTEDLSPASSLLPSLQAEVVEEEWQITWPSGIDYRQSASFDDRADDGEDCGAKILGTVVVGDQGKAYLKRTGCDLYMPITDDKGRTLMMLSSQVPHHGFFDSAMQNVKKKVLESIKDLSETESVASTGTTSELPEQSWPKPMEGLIAREGLMAREAFEEDEGVPDIDTGKGRRVILKFLQEWRPHQLKAMLGSQHIPISDDATPGDLRDKVKALCDTLDEEEDMSPSSRPAVQSVANDNGKPSDVKGLSWIDKVKRLVKKDAPPPPVDPVAESSVQSSPRSPCGGEMQGEDVGADKWVTGPPARLGAADPEAGITSTERLMDCLKEVVGISDNKRSQDELGLGGWDGPKPGEPAEQPEATEMQSSAPAELSDQENLATRKVLQRVWGVQDTDFCPAHINKPSAQPAPQLSDEEARAAQHAMIGLQLKQQQQAQLALQQQMVVQQANVKPAPAGFSRIQDQNSWNDPESDKAVEDYSAVQANQAMMHLQKKNRAISKSIDGYDPNSRDPGRPRYTDTDFRGDTLSSDVPRQRQCARGCMNRCVIS